MLFLYRTSLLCLNWSIRFCVFKAIYVNSTFLRVRLLQDALGTINELNIWFNLFLNCHAGSKSCVRYFCSSRRVITLRSVSSVWLSLHMRSPWEILWEIYIFVSLCIMHFVYALNLVLVNSWTFWVKSFDLILISIKK